LKDASGEIFAARYRKLEAAREGHRRRRQAAREEAGKITPDINCKLQITGAYC
jgi:hypothetical protein